MPNSDTLEDALPPLLDAFYARVREDDLIGPVFNDAIHDWPHHLARIGDFWSSVMLSSGRYKGNPVARHLPHAARLTPAAFERWLQIWRQTTDEHVPGPLAHALQAKAERIGESLQLALQFPSPAQQVEIERSRHRRKDDSPYGE